MSKLTLSEYAAKHRVTRRTLHNWFIPFRDQEIASHHSHHSGDVFIIDGYYLQYAATVLIAQTPRNEIVNWQFTWAENFSTWLSFLETIISFPQAVVCDGQRGMLKAIKQRFPGVIIQRCQFHVIHHVNLLLTKHPETEAARTFKDLIQDIVNVTNKLDLKIWLSRYREWYQCYHPFLKQRTYQEYEFTFRGRRKWHYTHGHLHAAFSHVKNALPHLFQYINSPDIPNTSNRIEGGVNAQIQRLIDHHRGTTLLQRRHMIAALLRQKQRPKPTQNFT